MRKLAPLTFLLLMLAAFAPQQQADGPPKLPASQTRKTVAIITDYIRVQLINNRCWTDHSDMAETARLQATFRIYIGRDGHLEKPPQLMAPLTTPMNDPQLQLFISHARAALDMCDAIGWRVPPEYYDLSPTTPYIDITFIPRVGSPG